MCLVPVSVPLRFALACVCFRCIKSIQRAYTVLKPVTRAASPEKKNPPPGRPRAGLVYMVEGVNPSGKIRSLPPCLLRIPPGVQRPIPSSGLWPRQCPHIPYLPACPHRKGSSHRRPRFRLIHTAAYIPAHRHENSRLHPDKCGVKAVGGGQISPKDGFDCVLCGR